MVRTAARSSDKIPVDDEPAPTQKKARLEGGMLLADIGAEGDENAESEEKNEEDSRDEDEDDEEDGEDADALARFANSLPAMRAWLTQHDVEKLLDEGGGLVTIDGFLPEAVARRAQSALIELEDAGGEWQEEIDDAGEHSFHFAAPEESAALCDLARIFWVALPDRMPSFCALRLQEGDHLGCRDDRVTSEALGPAGEAVEFSREIGLMYYLSEWEPQWGGQWVDIEGGQSPTAPCITPRFNAAVLWRVPRKYAVQRVRRAKAPLLALGGWWLKEGLRYPEPVASAGAEAADAAAAAADYSKGDDELAGATTPRPQRMATELLRGTDALAQVRTLPPPRRTSLQPRP
eukprot:SAG11_NODE_1990_length_3957_cov_4.708917_1_plen_348_part_00